MTTWIEPQYSRDQVDWAGEVLVENTGSLEDIPDVDLARDVVKNWRSAHSYPLNTMQMMLRRRAQSICEDAVIAQRLKRLRSIKEKLDRLDWIDLSEMQDLGGCRGVVSTIAELEELDEMFQNRDGYVTSELTKRDDYVAEPKRDGYRSIHYVYAYRPTTEKYRAHEGLKIEIQLRSHLQHLWATATETVSTFTEQSLKTGRGQEEWFTFFRLLADLLADLEGKPPVPDTPPSTEETRTQARDYERELSVRTRLSFWSTSTKVLTEEGRAAPWYLLTLSTDENELHAIPFSDKDRASDEYMRVEQEHENNPAVDSVLVSSESLSSLQKAYPNYYVDVGAFIRLLNEIFGEPDEG